MTTQKHKSVILDDLSLINPLIPIHIFLIHLKYEGGVAVTKAVKILALPRRGGSDPCQDLFGGFDIVN